jgi:hypothetical protein
VFSVTRHILRRRASARLEGTGSFSDTSEAKKFPGHDEAVKTQKVNSLGNHQDEIFQTANASSEGSGFANGSETEGREFISQDKVQHSEKLFKTRCCGEGVASFSKANVIF